MSTTKTDFTELRVTIGAYFAEVKHLRTMYDLTHRVLISTEENLATEKQKRIALQRKLALYFHHADKYAETDNKLAGELMLIYEKKLRAEING